MALTPGWPDDPETVTEAREHPEVFAGEGIGEIADYERGAARPGQGSVEDVQRDHRRRHRASRGSARTGGHRRVTTCC